MKLGPKYLKPGHIQNIIVLVKPLKKKRESFYFSFRSMDVRKTLKLGHILLHKPCMSLSFSRYKNDNKLLPAVNLHVMSESFWRIFKTLLFLAIEK